MKKQTMFNTILAKGFGFISIIYIISLLISSILFLIIELFTGNLYEIFNDAFNEAIQNWNHILGFYVLSGFIFSILITLDK